MVGAAASLFAFVGARHVNQRLVLTGYRPRDIMVGRLLSLLALTWMVALVVGVVMVAGSRPERPGDVFLALALTTLVSTSVGWLTTAVLPRELEGTLLLIGLVGLQVSIPVSGAADIVIHYFGPLRLTDYDRSPIGPGGPILHSLAWSLLIALAALALWRRRVLVHTHGPAEALRRETHRRTRAAPLRRSEKDRVSNRILLIAGGVLGSASGVVGAWISDPEVGFPAWIDLTGVVAGFGLGVLVTGVVLLLRRVSLSFRDDRPA